MQVARKVLIATTLFAVLPLLLLSLVSGILMQNMSEMAISEMRAKVIEENEEKILQWVKGKSNEINLFFESYRQDTRVLCEFSDTVYNNYSLLKDAYWPEYYPDVNHTGFPGFGYIHPVFGVYADWEGRGLGNPFLSSKVVNKSLANESYRSYVVEELHKVMLFDMIFPEIYSKHRDTADLVWNVRLGGFSNCHPWFSYEELLNENPGLDELVDDEQDYVVMADPEHNPQKKEVWLPPYLDATKGVWMTSCIAPIYQGNEFIGTVGIDVLLSTLSDFANRAKYTNGSYVFILSGEGLVVEMPQEGIAELAWNETHRNALYEILKPVDAQNWTEEMVAAMENTSLRATPDPEVASIVREMLGGNLSVRKAMLSGKEKIVAFAPLPSVGWSIGIVVPEDEVLGPVQDAAAKMESGISNVPFYFGLIAVAVLVASVAGSLILSSAILRPFNKALDRFREAADRISRGETDELLRIETEEPLITEIAKAFQRLQNTAIVALKELEEREKGGGGS
ncbi:MAG: cache domain-containing protein [Thermoplasmata archaeon]|nr:cache domain-containing protein [Thermoplasmata archaeon]